MIEKHTHVTEENIKLLVDKFYVKVRKDPELGLIFEKAIGIDTPWHSHLERMYAFWSSIMLTSGRYSGTPVKKHTDLPFFDLALFERWLELFEETAREIYTEDIVLQYQQKSQNIARSLKLNIGQSRK